MWSSEKWHYDVWEILPVLQRKLVHPSKRVTFSLKMEAAVSFTCTRLYGFPSQKIVTFSVMNSWVPEWWGIS
jgi:hypothetical protein